MFWAILNLLLSILETTVIWRGHYRFMKVNSRTIYRRKCWYIISFIMAGIVFLLVSAFLPDSWMGPTLLFVLPVILGFLLFHRKILPLILDILFSGVLLIGMECGIYIFNIVLLHTGIQIFPNLACVGCIAMLIKIIIILILSNAMVYWKKVHSSGALSLGQTLSVLVLPLFSVFFMYAIMRMQIIYTQLYGVWLVLATMAALLLLNIYFLYLFSYLFRVNKLEQEMQIIQLQNELQYRHYEELERKYRESRKILHDMKNHLQAVEQLYEGQGQRAGDNYVQDLYHMINVLGEKYYSANPMLNIILNEKLNQAEMAGIQVKAEVGDVDFNDIKDMDITTIFANLLDNAIEAASQCGSGSTRPWLELKIDNVQDFRVIKLRNAVTPPGHLSGTQNTTANTRTRLPHMGLGLINVQQTINKYNGSFEQSKTTKEYCITVIFPGKEV